MIGSSYVLLLAILTGLALAMLPFTRPTPQLVGPTVSAAAAKANPAEVNPENDFDAHVARLKQKLPSNDFSIVIQPPLWLSAMNQPTWLKSIPNARSNGPSTS
jgi:hypothetical protein